MKKLLSVLFTSLLSIPFFALPGFTPAIPDTPGEYVFYRDTTFERESYIGFVAYDNTTYGCRYISPENKNHKQAELSVELYFTLDPKASHIELTGEKIISARTQDDAEIINYLHDMVYELNARRIKAGNFADGSDTLKIDDDFMQFGGSVSVIYDKKIPLFNVSQIIDANGKKSFYVVTLGRLRASEDTAFTDFKGIPEKYLDNKHNFKLDKKAAAVQVSSEIKLNLDSMWNQQMENLWTCGDAAILTIYKLNGPQVENFTLLEKQLSISSGSTFIDYQSLSTGKTETELLISSIYFEKADSNVTRNLKLLQKIQDNSYLINLTVFENLYQKNKTYFDSIINSCRIN